MKETLLNWSIYRNLFLLVTYVVLGVLSFYFAFELRFDFEVPANFQKLRIEVVPWIIPLKIVFLYIFGQFSGLLTYFRLPDLYRLFIALASYSAVILIIYWFSYKSGNIIPRGVILSDFVFSLFAIGSFRIGLRIYRESFLTKKQSKSTKLRLAGIVGAGEAGSSLVASLLSSRHQSIRPLVFFDDDKSKIGMSLHGIPVSSTTKDIVEVAEKLNLDIIIIAISHKYKKEIREIIEIAYQASLDVSIIPSIHELMSGNFVANYVRPVEIEDVLGRQPVQIDDLGIRETLSKESVLITGAGGSIGNELCRQVLKYSPNRLIMVDQSEPQLFVIEQELIGAGYGTLIVPLVANILDHDRMDYIFAHYKPTLVFHAAAHKHVPMLERQPSEAVKNNSLGTCALAKLANKYAVKKFTLISTDKAINPTSVMGASKRIAEMLLQAYQRCPQVSTQFIIVRFGNVLGSSGSVVPIFKRQIENGGPVTVTHPEVTRYFMTIPEAVSLVLQSAAQGVGGNTFVLDMGEPVKILHLANQLIELSGKRAGVDIEIKFTGLRPGEKLYEEIQHQKEHTRATGHPSIFLFLSQETLFYDSLLDAVMKLLNDSYSVPTEVTKRSLKQLVPEYTPFYE